MNALFELNETTTQWLVSGCPDIYFSTRRIYIQYNIRNKIRLYFKNYLTLDCLVFISPISPLYLTQIAFNTILRNGTSWIEIDYIS